MEKRKIEKYGLHENRNKKNITPIDENKQITRQIIGTFKSI